MPLSQEHLTVLSPGVLVTRPAPEAEGFARQLKLAGLVPYQEPLLHIRACTHQRPLKPFQALIFTSLNGIRSFHALSSDKELPVFVAGHSSAALAQNLGYQKVIVCPGGGEAIISKIKDLLTPAEGEILHISGQIIGCDVLACLYDVGFQGERLVCYEAHEAQSLSEASRQGMLAGAISAVTFFSPRTADIFIRLLKAYNLENICSRLHAFCLSENIALSLEAFPWHSINVSSSQTGASLINCLLQKFKEKNK